MMEMKKYKLGDLLDVKRGTSLSGEYYSTEGEYVRLTCGNFDYTNNSFKENTSKDNIFYTGNVREEFIMQKGDIITPLTEQAIGLLGSTAIIPESNKYIQSQDVAKIICNETLLYPLYAFYLISSEIVKKQLSAAAQQTKIRHTSPDKIKDCIVWIPELPKQKRIASILSALDKKIALNRQINQNLEALARQLYDYWFVQFDFPDANGKPYKSSGGKMVYNPILKREIPEGWEGVVLRDVIQHINTGLNPRDNFTFGGEIKYITVKNLTKDGYIDFSSCDTIDEDARCKVHTRSQIEVGDILYASICPLGRTYLITEEPNDWDINESVFSIRPNYKKITSEYLNMLLKDDYYIAKLSNSSTGSIFLGIRIKQLESTQILLPSYNILSAFTKQIKDIVRLQAKNYQQILSLTKQRDELLPLLMNGQVNFDLLVCDIIFARK